KEFRYIDFALPGQIGFSLLSLATFGVAFGMITLRETLVLKRIFATTVRPIQFVLALVLSRSFQAVLQAAAIIVIGVLAFDFTLQDGWMSGLSMLVLSFLGILTFVGFGILISNLAKDENTLPIALNIFNLPQFLLSGVFFPIDDMPATVRLIGNNLPLSYLNIALRKVSIEGLGLFEVWPYILGMLGWAIFSYLIAAKTFKTE
ncbi:MAG: antibiotic transport system permease protein, partial [Candidatus Berkelbacteria bacterium Gr01-1014_85]